MTKANAYEELVAARKACNRCHELENPAQVEGGRWDCEQIGAWSLWQGNLDAKLMVVGQDWGGTDYFLKNQGRDK